MEVGKRLYKIMGGGIVLWRGEFFIDWDGVKSCEEGGIVKGF